MAYTISEFKSFATPVDKRYIRFWEGSTHVLPAPITPDIDRLTEKDLSRTAFKIVPTLGTPFYVDNALREYINKHNWEKYIKSSFLSNYFKSYPYTNYSKYIFRWDKEAKHIGKNDTYVRADYLKISIGAQNKAHRDRGVVTIRANGSIEGISEKYNSIISKAWPNLVRIQQGPNNCGVPLDILDSLPIKNHSLQENIDSIYADLHHFLVVNGASIDKTVEPTLILSRIEFTKLTHNQIIEILKCIILAPGLHKEAHRILGSNHGFEKWLQLYKDNKIKMLPYYLVNEENYNETLDWLSSICSNFDKGECASYEDFIDSISYS